MNSSENSSRNFDWLSGKSAAAVRAAGASLWLTTRSLGSANIPLAVHLQILLGVSVADPGAIKAPSGRDINVPHLVRWQVQVVLIMLGLAWLFLGNIVKFDTNSGMSGESSRLILGGGILAWMSLVLSDALILRSQIAGNVPIAKLSLLGVRIEPVAWVLMGSSSTAWFSLLSPFLLVLIGFSGMYPSHFGMGMVAASFLLLLQRSCPFIYGPMSFLLAKSRGVQDFPRVLQLSWASWWMPGQSTFAGRTVRFLRSGNLSTILWLVLACIGFTFLIEFPHSEMFLDQMWSGFWTSVFVVFGIWLCVAAWQTYRISLIMRFKGSSKIYEPNALLLRHWKERCALVHQVPNLAGLRWEWYQVEAGYPLAQYGQMGTGFGWVASGTLEMMGRQADGTALRALGTISAGSAFGCGMFLNSVPSDHDLVALESSIVVRLPAQQVESLSDEIRRKLVTYVQMSQGFDHCNTFQGIHFALKELWLAKGRIVWVPGGTILFEAGEEATWMGMLVQGALRIEGEAKQMLSGSEILVGDEVMHGAKRRTFTLLTEEPIVMVRWDSSWIRQWMPRQNQDEQNGEQMNQMQLATHLW